MVAHTHEHHLDPDLAHLAHQRRQDDPARLVIFQMLGRPEDGPRLAAAPGAEIGGKLLFQPCFQPVEIGDVIADQARGMLVRAQHQFARLAPSLDGLAQGRRNGQPMLGIDSVHIGP